MKARERMTPGAVQASRKGRLAPGRHMTSDGKDEQQAAFMSQSLQQCFMRTEIQVWREQAKADLKTAEVNLEGNRYYATVFFCHQAIEKGLKAYFLKRSRSPESPEMKSHSLIFLAKPTRVPEKFRSFLRELTSDCLTTRTPARREISRKHCTTEASPTLPSSEPRWLSHG